MHKAIVSIAPAICEISLHAVLYQLQPYNILLFLYKEKIISSKSETDAFTRHTCTCVNEGFTHHTVLYLTV